MLRLDQLVAEVDGVQVWRDHRDPTLYWYAPARPRVARGDDGSPLVSLTRYSGPDGDGTAGVLDLTLELTVDQAELAAVQAGLPDPVSGEAPLRLVPAPLRDLSFEVRTEGDPRSRTVLTEGHSRGAGAERQSLALRLGPDLASLVEQGFQSRTLPLEIVASAILVGTELVWDGVERFDLAEKQLGWAASEVALGSSWDPDAHIRHLDLEDPFFSQVAVEFVLHGDLEQHGLRAIEVEWKYVAADGDGHVGMALLGPGGEPAHRFAAWRGDSGSSTSSYRLRAHPAATANWSGPQSTWEGPWIATAEPRVDLYAHNIAPGLEVAFELGRVDPKEVELVQVDVQVDDRQHDLTFEDSLLLRPGSAEPSDARQVYRARLPHSTTSTARWRATWSLGGGQRHKGSWTDVDASKGVASVLVPSPFTGRRDLRLWKAWQGEALEAVVDYRYHEERSGYRKDDVATRGADDSPDGPVRVPVIDPIDARLDYSMTLVRADGSMHQVRQLEPRGDVLLLTDAPWVERPVQLRVDATAFGDDGAGIEIEIWSTGTESEDRATVVLRPDPGGGQARGRAVLAYPHDAAFTWSWKTRRVTGKATWHAGDEGNGAGPVLRIEG